MPGGTALFWLYGYASHLLLAKSLVAIRGQAGDQHTALFLVQIWNIAKLICGFLEFVRERRKRRRKLGRLLSTLPDNCDFCELTNSINDTADLAYNPLDPPSFGGDPHGRVFSPSPTVAGRTMSERGSRASYDYSMDEISISVEQDESEGGMFLEETATAGSCWPQMSAIVRAPHLAGSIASGSSTEEVTPLQLAQGVQWWWFVWFMNGWLEFGAILLTFRALEETFVSKCQTHRYWAIVFIAAMQMLFDDETLVHSVLGLGLITLGLLLSVITGLLTKGRRIRADGSEAPLRGVYVEEPMGALLALCSGLMYSAQMFVHELFLDLTPRSSSYKSLIYEACGALYLCGSMYPLLIELGLTDVLSGLANLRMNWPLTLWYVSSCGVAVGANLLQRHRASPFSRSVAFILQLPLVYVIEVGVLRWRRWRLLECCTIMIFLSGFCLSTAVIPFRLYGPFVQNALLRTAFYKPQWTSQVATLFQSWVADFRGKLEPPGGPAFAKNGSFSSAEQRRGGGVRKK